MLGVLVALLAALLLAGCGGTQIQADEVSGAPPELAVPEGEAAGALEDADAASSSSSDDQDSDTTSTSTSTDEQSSGDSAGGSSPSSGGGAAAGSGGASAGSTATPAPQATATPAPTQAPAAPQDDAQNDAAPPASTGAERFEDFCQQNPGAC